MNVFKPGLLAVSISLVTILTGCTGAFDAMNRDPVRVELIRASEDRLILGTVSLSAEKRNVLVSVDGSGKARYCAEPPPEIAKTFTIDRSALLEGEGEFTPEQEAKLKAEIKDRVEEAITTLLGERTALLEIYRTGTYSLCQYFVNGAISGEQLDEQFRELTAGVMAALTPADTDP